MARPRGASDQPARRPPTQRRRPRHPARPAGHGRQRAVVRLRGARADLQGRPPARSPTSCSTAHDEARARGRRAGPALELRRRRRAVPARLRGAAHPPRAPLRPGAGRPHLARRAAAAPDHGGLRGDAAAPAAALPAGRRPRRRQDDHGRAAHQGADRPRRPAALPRSSAPAAWPSSGRTSSTAGSTCPSRSSPTTSSRPRAPATGSWRPTSSSPASTSSRRNEDVQQKLQAPDCRWDLVVCDEAHKMSATFFGGEIKYTKRYQLGQLLSAADAALPADDGDAAQRQGGGLPALHGAARRRPLRGPLPRRRPHQPTSRT